MSVLAFAFAFAWRLLMVSLKEYLVLSVVGALGVMGVGRGDDGGCVSVVFVVEGCNCAEECFPYSKCY